MHAQKENKHLQDQNRSPEEPIKGVGLKSGGGGAKDANKSRDTSKKKRRPFRKEKKVSYLILFALFLDPYWPFIDPHFIP